ncbi:MAG: nicotinate (nicotinamide) nucleotide adenylyltransferase [Bacteroidia bacterium]
MKMGLFFGSFNPIHMGHLMMARLWLNLTDLERIWFILSPHNPHKNPSQLAAPSHRLAMLRLALENQHSLVASDVEFHLPRPSFTYQTWKHLLATYSHEFIFLMGCDTYQKVPSWYEGDKLLTEVTFYVAPREGCTFTPLNPKTVFFSDFPRITLSATLIRHFVSQGKPITFLVPPSVELYIYRHGLYQAG